MPKYGFHVGSTFNPTSVEDYLRPGLAYVQTYKDYEKRYQGMIDATADLKKLAEMEGSEQAYATYDAYQKQLKEAANNLATTGWNRDRDIQSAMDLRRQFAEDIVPIKEAYNTWTKRADEQRAMLAKDNTLLFADDASIKGVDYFIEHPNAINQSYSGALLAEQVANISKNIARNMEEDPTKWRSILGNTYYNNIRRSGYRLSDIANVIKYGKPEVLNKIIDDVIDSSGIKGWADENILKRAKKYAEQGLYNAIGIVEMDNLSNPFAKSRSNENNEYKGNGILYRMVPKVTVDGDDNADALAEDIKTLEEVIANPELLNKQGITYSDGKIITNDGQATSVVTQGQPIQGTDYPYRTMLEHMAKVYNFDVFDSNGYFDSEKAKTALQDMYDTVQSTAVKSNSYLPNITDSDLISKVMKENAISISNRTKGKSGLYALDDKGRKDNDQIDIKDISKYLSKDSSFQYIPTLGFVVNNIDSDGKPRYAVIDTALFDDADRRFALMQEEIDKALENKEYTAAQLIIDTMMAEFYYKFNTLAKRQSNTDSGI